MLFLIGTALALVSSASAALCNTTVTQLGFYTPVCDAGGSLVAPLAGGLQAALDASVDYYDRSPLSLPLAHGLPPFVWATFTDGVYIPTSTDIIAGMQTGMGILGYLAFHARAVATGKGNATAALRAARFL